MKKIQGPNKHEYIANDPQTQLQQEAIGIYDL